MKYKNLHWNLSSGNFSERQFSANNVDSFNRLAQWPADSQLGGHQEEELKVQLHSVQKERNELRSKVDAMNSKVNNKISLK